MGMLRWQDHELTGSANLSPTNFCPVDTVAGSLCVAYGNKAMKGVNMQSLFWRARALRDSINPDSRTPKARWESHRQGGLALPLCLAGRARRN